MSLLVDPMIVFCLVVLFIMPLRKIACLLGLVDTPDARKQHGKAIPPVGGLILFSIFMLYGIFADVISLQEYWPLLISLIVLLVSGAIDDQMPIPARIKLFIHLSAAIFIVLVGGMQTAYLGNLFGLGDIGTDFMSIPFSIIAVVLLINAINLMDGMDGLAGGASVVMFGWFACGAYFAGWHDMAGVLFLLMASIGGFLVFNMRNPLRRKASLFLGDAGSLSLGLTIAWFGIALAQKPSVPIEPIAVAWIMGFPIFDICAQFFRRVCNGRNPFAPDRGHFHHHFIEAGVPVIYATPIILMIMFLMGAFGYISIWLGVPQVILTVTWIAAFFGHIYMSFKPERYVRLIGFFYERRQAVIEGCVDKG